MSHDTWVCRACNELNTGWQGVCSRCLARWSTDATFRWRRVRSSNDLEEFYRSLLPHLRVVARSLGYALAVHGSLRRDLDLVAVPWVTEYEPKERLADALMYAGSGGLTQDPASFVWEAKPHGRVATSFPICLVQSSEVEGWPPAGAGHVDLSVVLPSEQLLGLLQHLEWSGSDHPDDFCRSCLGVRRDGHRLGCPVARGLGRA